MKVQVKQFNILAREDLAEKTQLSAGIVLSGLNRGLKPLSTVYPTVSHS